MRFLTKHDYPEAIFDMHNYPEAISGPIIVSG